MSGQDATPAAEPSGRPAKRKCVGFVAAGVAVAVLLAGGGWVGWSAYEHHRLESARAACADASESLRIAMNEYNTLKTGKATDMAGVTAKQVADAKTVDALAGALDAKEPATAACVADSRADYETQTGRVEANRDWYVKHRASLAKAVKTVEKSRDAKTIADAAKLLKDSKGKVADEKTRTALDKAVKAKDTDAVAKAVKAVNDSMKAKAAADAKAKAAQTQTASAGATESASGSTNGYASSGSTGYSGYSGYSSGSTGYSGGYSPGSTGGYTGGSSSTGASGAPAQSTGNGGGSRAPSQSTSGGSGDMPYIPPNQSCTADIDGGWCSTGGSGEMYY